MNHTRLQCAALLVAALGLSWHDAVAAPKFNLRPEGKGKVCLTCHSDVETLLKKPVVHTPIKRGECIGCHSPHAATTRNLLWEDGGAVCGRCHQMVPKERASAHAPVLERACQKCHLPHAGDQPDLLTKPMLDLCADCHPRITEAATTARRKHRPVVDQGCTVCHDPHASTKAGALLKQAVPGLCVGCHKAERPGFAKKHMDYPVAKSRCTSCHDPHGSNQPGMLYNDVHQPVAKHNCAQCHGPPVAGKPVEPKKTGLALCQTCHADLIGKMLAKNRLHRPVANATACLNCHAAHASSRKPLLQGELKSVCGECHRDTLARQAASVTKHPPIRDGECVKCHDPHTGDEPLLFKRATDIEVCGVCHSWKEHQSHPIGGSRRDPRNPNLTLNCLSCHRAHGTEYKNMFPYPTTTTLCTQCHVEQRR
ncbi:MAG: cytochrome c3 family protein [Deltaproteobacteria bacterium]|nr:cytochrome c3 family protein [Deltaproteobacteria bacterium]